MRMLFALASAGAQQPYAPPKNRTLADLQELALKHLNEADLRHFHKATGWRVAELFALSKQWIEKASAMGTEARFVRAFMSNCALYAHELNACGLHALRALLGERLSSAHRLARHSDRHPLWSAMNRDGILVLPEFNVNGSRLVTQNALELLRMVSGYRRVPSRWSRFKTYRHVAGDPQFYMHVDTLHPTWKVFLFGPGTTLRNGPFHYVNGSHGAHSAGKLRWLFERSRAHTSVTPTQQGNGVIFSMDEAAVATTSSPPGRSGQAAPQQKLTEGPYTDATHGKGGAVSSAIRFSGFEPKAGSSSVAAQLAGYELATPTPILVAGKLPTLVIVDTSGLHYRGYASPGASRVSARLDGIGGGCGGCIPRKNVFTCSDAPLHRIDLC